MSKDKPLISIVIRNRNEAEHLKYVLAALQQQEFTDFEIVVVDNNSSDKSSELAQTSGAKLVTIDNFTYGKGLNRGIEESSGELIVILSAHSIPLGRYFLTECARAFTNPAIGAARLVYIGKSADATRWLKTEYLTSAEEDFVSKGPLASGCVIRKKAWKDVRFDESVIAAEEKIWAFEILKRGYKIASPIPAFYYYSKRLTKASALKKNYRELVALHRRFNMTGGFIKSGKKTIIYDLFWGIIYSLNLAFNNIYLELVKAYLRLKFPKI